MNVRIEKKSGFCFGVKRVIQMAEEALDKGEKLYCLGEIVHNQKEVERLTAKGMVFIDTDDLKELTNVKVLIRAHGEPPETYALAERNNIELIDGTCPIVRTLQKKVKDRFEDSGPETRILIYGKKGHPEVIGLNGQTGYNALVISSVDEVPDPGNTTSISLFSQTTMDGQGFAEVCDKLSTFAHPGLEIEINNTICNHISHRQPGIEAFAESNELILFVAGKNSSNGRILYEICRKKNPNSYLISELEDIQAEWFTGVNNVGITGATSTPVWFLEQVKERLRNFTIN